MTQWPAMSLIDVDITDRVATITLNNPERRNSLTLDMADEMSATVEQVESMDVGAMVVTGAGKAFCAGADLDVLEAADGPSLVRIYKSFTRLHASNVPSIAAVNGPAVGAGFNLALCADLRLAGPDAYFDTGFGRLNIHPGGGSTWLMTKQLGLQGAMALAVFGESLDADEAERIGMVWKTIRDGDVVTAAQEMALRAASAPPMLMRKVNHTVNKMLGVEEHGLATQLELDEQLWSLRQPEAREAIAAQITRISAS